MVLLTLSYDLTHFSAPIACLPFPLHLALAEDQECVSPRQSGVGTAEVRDAQLTECVPPMANCDFFLCADTVDDLPLCLLLSFVQYRYEIDSLPPTSIYALIDVTDSWAPTLRVKFYAQPLGFRADAFLGRRIEALQCCLRRDD